MATKSQVQVEAHNLAKVGDKVLVYTEPGKDPILAIVDEIDHATGIILTVVIKDENKRNKILNVKDKIITFVPFLWSVFQVIRGWFKKK